MNLKSQPGGGVCAAESRLHVYGNTTVAYNIAKDSGGLPE